MKIDTKLEQILQSAFNAGYYYGTESSNQNYDKRLTLNQSKILALGKPEPLVKNKQTERICKDCNGTGLYHYTYGGTECNRCDGTGLANTRDATSR